MSAPISIIANRSWFAGSCASNVDVSREMSPCGATTNTAARMTGRSAVNLRSFKASSNPTAAHAPIQAFRVKVSRSAATSAGITSAGQMRSLDPNTSRPAAMQITSIRMPEYVM